MIIGRSVHNRIDIFRQCELPNRFYLRTIIKLIDRNVNLVNEADILWDSVYELTGPLHHMIIINSLNLKKWR